MANKKHGSEQAVAKLRQIDVLLGEGKSISQACKDAGIADVTSRIRRATSVCRFEGIIRNNKSSVPIFEKVNNEYQ